MVSTPSKALQIKTKGLSSFSCQTQFIGTEKSNDNWKTSLGRSQNKTLCLVVLPRWYFYDMDWEWGWTQRIYWIFKQFTSDNQVYFRAIIIFSCFPWHHIKDGKISTDLYVKPTDTHQYLLSSSFATHIIQKDPSPTVLDYASAAFVQMTPHLTKGVMNSPNT